MHSHCSIKSHYHQQLFQRDSRALRNLPTTSGSHQGVSLCAHKEILTAMARWPSASSFPEQSLQFLLGCERPLPTPNPAAASAGDSRCWFWRHQPDSMVALQSVWHTEVTAPAPPFWRTVCHQRIGCLVYHFPSRNNLLGCIACNFLSWGWQDQSMEAVL